MSTLQGALWRRMQAMMDPGNGRHGQVAGRAAARPGLTLRAVSYTTGEGTSTVVHRRLVLGLGEHGYGAEFV